PQPPKPSVSSRPAPASRARATTRRSLARLQTSVTSCPARSRAALIPAAQYASDDHPRQDTSCRTLTRQLPSPSPPRRGEASRQGGAIHGLDLGGVALRREGGERPPTPRLTHRPRPIGSFEKRPERGRLRFRATMLVH